LQAKNCFFFFIHMWLTYYASNYSLNSSIIKMSNKHAFYQLSITHSCFLSLVSTKDQKWINLKYYKNFKYFFIFNVKKRSKWHLKITKYSIITLGVLRESTIGWIIIFGYEKPNIIIENTYDSKYICHLTYMFINIKSCWQCRIITHSWYINISILSASPSISMIW